MESGSCEHLDKIADAVNNYNIILAYYVTCLAEDASRKKATDVYCRVCNSKNRRIHACLECAFFGCFDQNNGTVSHMKDHAEKNEHNFAVNINYGCLFCFKCDDYIYNETFEDLFKDYKLEAGRIDGIQVSLPWTPKAQEIAKLKDKIRKISDESYIGLRGIANIGYSCYVNCVIQVFMHNPVLRDFFLSDMHECFLKGSCLTCEMFILYQEFYSGISVPYVPSEQFKSALQFFCKSSLGAQQSDTYEFILEILNGLHSSCQKIRQTENCKCMIHEMFYGIIQSYRECSKCKASSYLPLDQFMDISLHLERENDSLVEILNRKFLEPQLADYHTCSNTDCKKIDTTYLYQTIKKLPTVICFRLNCFSEKKSRRKKIQDSEEKTNRRKKKQDSKEEKLFQKKSTAFAFEDWIDMSPYLNSKSDIKLSNGNHSSNFHPDENRYRLFAVIFHKGDLDGGHYVAYVRQRRNRWFECDDKFIYKRSLKQVLESEPILLFYHKQK